MFHGHTATDGAGSAVQTNRAGRGRKSVSGGDQGEFGGSFIRLSPPVRSGAKGPW